MTGDCHIVECIYIHRKVKEIFLFSVCIDAWMISESMDRNQIIEEDNEK